MSKIVLFSNSLDHSEVSLVLFHLLPLPGPFSLQCMGWEVLSMLSSKGTFSCCHLPGSAPEHQDSVKPFVPKCVTSLSTPMYKPSLWSCQHPDAREVFLQLFLWLDNAPCAKSFYSFSLICQNIHQNLLFLHLRPGQMLCKLSLFKLELMFHCTSFVFN